MCAEYVSNINGGKDIKKKKSESKTPRCKNEPNLKKDDSWR